eukprot:g3125.t1
MPEVRLRKLSDQDRYLLLGCDGIWERFTNQQVVDFVLPRLQEQDRLSTALSAFLTRALRRSATVGVLLDSVLKPDSWVPPSNRRRRFLTRIRLVRMLSYHKKVASQFLHLEEVCIVILCFLHTS